MTSRGVCLALVLVHLASGGVSFAEHRELAIGVSVALDDKRLVRAGQDLESLRKEIRRLLEEEFPRWTFSSQIDGSPAKITMRIYGVGARDVRLKFELGAMERRHTFEELLFDRYQEGLTPLELAARVSGALKARLSKEKESIEDLLVRGAPLAEGGEWLKAESVGSLRIVLPLQTVVYGERLRGEKLLIECHDPRTTCRFDHPKLRSRALREGTSYRFSPSAEERMMLTVEPYKRVCSESESDVTSDLQQVLSPWRTYLMGDQGTQVDPTSSGPLITVPPGHR